MRKLLAVMAALLALAGCEKHFSMNTSSTSGEIYGSREFPYVETCAGNAGEAELEVSITRASSPDPIKFGVSLSRSAGYQEKTIAGTGRVTGVQVSVKASARSDGQTLFDDGAVLLVPFFEDRSVTVGAYRFDAHWVKKPAAPVAKATTI